MEQLTKFDKENLKHLRNEILHSLKGVSEKYGVNFQLGNIHFSDFSFSVKLSSQLHKKSDDLGVKTIEPLIDLLGEFAPLKFGDKINTPKGILKIIEFNRRPKYNVVCLDENNVRILITKQYAKDHIIR